MSKKIFGHTPLERACAQWLNAEARDYDSGVAGVINDLRQGGCQSGMVGELIYYTDTVKFYKRYQAEIDDLYAKGVREFGKDFLGDKWDDADPFARDVQNQNLLAWLGFEETCFRLASEAGYE